MESIYTDEVAVHLCVCLHEAILLCIMTIN